MMDQGWEKTHLYQGSSVMYTPGSLFKRHPYVTTPTIPRELGSPDLCSFLNVATLNKSPVSVYILLWLCN